MELESIHVNYDGHRMEESFVDKSSLEISGICGNPEISTRVGDLYQAEIPPMISESEQLQLPMNAFDSDSTFDDASHSFLIGSSIPITWGVCHRIKKSKELSESLTKPENVLNTNESGKSRKSKMGFVKKKKGSKLNAALLDVGINDGINSKPEYPKAKLAGKTDIEHLHQVQNYSALPGSLNEPWSDSEVDAFVLGLYIFGKKFVRVKRFIDCKEMGDILSFYYGRFYRSDEYHRWSNCRNTQAKNCIYGHRIFTGWRHQELFSRLQPHVPEHLQNSLLEISLAITYGKFSLEDCVSHLKALVGVQVLVDAIGIGKGKDDLTGHAMEPVKNNPVFSGPIGKDFSSLTSSEIIKLLTGDFRLSKARYNDIFWEAVWPRLLAREWHSEQLKNQGYFDSKLPLVFLIPGVAKFSRRNLVKGKHYFDSVSEVLSKVVSEPRLLELEAEEARIDSPNEENKCVRVSSDLDDQSVQPSHYYLRPQVSSRILNIVNFTVVDSSLFHGKELSKVRRMRFSPDELNGRSLTTTLSRKKARTLPENSLDALEVSSDSEKCIDHADFGETISDDCGSNNRKLTVVDTSLLESSIGLPNGEKNVNKCNHRKGMSDYSGTKHGVLNSDATDKVVESLQDQIKMSNPVPSGRNIKQQYHRRIKGGNSNELVPLVKRRRLTACPSEEISHVVENCSVVGSKQVKICCSPESPRADCHPRETQSSTKSNAEGCQEVEISGSTFSADGQVTKKCCSDNAENQPSFFAEENLHLVSVKSENGKPAAEAENRLGVSIDHTCFPPHSDDPAPDASNTSDGANPAPESCNMKRRRRSTRKGPMTYRAMQAIECGFLDFSKKGKRRVCSKEISVSSAVKANNQVKTISTCRRNEIAGTGVADAGEQMDAKDVHSQDILLAEILTKLKKKNIK